jgi:D-sedoheptulose 7-phosphate isomerase
MEMKDTIRRLVGDTVETQRKLLSPEYVDVLERIARLIVQVYKSNCKLIIFGNGGSACDAQHFAAELVVRFEKNRAALPAIALTANVANLTAIGNDFDFDDIFSRQVAALCQAGDLVIGISTSGNSRNVIKGVEQAHRQKAVTVGFTGIKGGKIKDKLDICFCAPSTVTARVQECHILAIHLLCSLVEDALFGEK